MVGNDSSSIAPFMSMAPIPLPGVPAGGTNVGSNIRTNHSLPPGPTAMWPGALPVVPGRGNSANTAPVEESQTPVAASRAASFVASSGPAPSSDGATAVDSSGADASRSNPASVARGCARLVASAPPPGPTSSADCRAAQADPVSGKIIIEPTMKTARHHDRTMNNRPRPPACHGPGARASEGSLRPLSCRSRSTGSRPSGR